jgi:CcmD family protein
MKKILPFLLILVSLNLQAQQEVEMADQLRSDGKIYVVVAVVSIILLGILLYLIRIDSKVSKLEKESKGEID